MLGTMLCCAVGLQFGLQCHPRQPRCKPRGSPPNAYTTFKKAAGLVVISDDLAREGLIETELRNGVVAAVDGAFLAKLIASTSPIASSGNVLEDLATLFSSVNSGSASSW
jgi:hypothetical protein